MRQIITIICVTYVQKIFRLTKKYPDFDKQALDIIYRHLD